MKTPLWTRGGIAGLVIFLLVSLARFGICEADNVPFSIIFSKSKVAFSGTVDSRATVTALADALIAARPDLKVVNDGLSFDPEATFPNLTYFKNLVVEVGLSTYEGEIEISDDFLMIGGLTDSIVTISILRLRADPILGNRTFKERICQVPTEDLPVTPIFLSNGETRQGFSFNLELQEKKSVQFEAPGVLLDKLFNLIEGTGNLDRLMTGRPGPAPSTEAMTVTGNNPAPTSEVPGTIIIAEATAPSPPPTIPTAGSVDEPEPPNPYLDLGPVLFARNNVLLQGGQRNKIESISTQLQSSQWEKQPVIVQAVTYQSGARAFDEWLSKRRLAEVVKLLTGSGIASGLVRTETKESSESIDQGMVHILLKIPEHSSP